MKLLRILLGIICPITLLLGANAREEMEMYGARVEDIEIMEQKYGKIAYWQHQSI